MSDGLGQPSSDVHTVNSMAIGQPYYVLAYVNDYDSHTATTKHSTPVARYTCYFRAESAPQDLNNLDYNRTDSLLEAKYTKVADISFDDEEGMNFNKPKQAFTKGDAYNNQWDKPVEWSRSNYSFTYPGLRDYSYYHHEFGAGRYYITPLHSDYAILKSINDNPASQNNTTSGYYWYTQKRSTMQPITSRGIQNMATLPTLTLLPRPALSSQQTLMPTFARGLPWWPPLP